VSGIGFLAGGSILRSGATVQGLTTAAGLWLVTAVGLCAGSGMYVEGISATALGVVALTLLRRFEHKDKRMIHRRVTVVLGDGAAAVVDIVAAIKGAGGQVVEVDYDRRLDEKKRMEVSLDVLIDAEGVESAIVKALESQEGIRRIRVRAPT
jgi:putative Mg2+ transporter-C (MgtC) family protein